MRRRSSRTTSSSSRGEEEDVNSIHIWLKKLVQAHHMVLETTEMASCLVSHPESRQHLAGQRTDNSGYPTGPPPPLYRAQQDHEDALRRIVAAKKPYLQVDEGRNCAIGSQNMTISGRTSIRAEPSQLRCQSLSRRENPHGLTEKAVAPGRRRKWKIRTIRNVTVLPSPASLNCRSTWSRPCSRKGAYSYPHICQTILIVRDVCVATRAQP